MEQRQLEQEFAAWLDKVSRRPIPAEARAFCVNLSESVKYFQAEVIGAPRFDPGDADWACREVFTSGPKRLRLPHVLVGDQWEPVLSLVSGWVRSYLAGRAAAGNRLCESTAVAVGFVDGDLVRVWPPDGLTPGEGG